MRHVDCLSVASLYGNHNLGLTLRYRERQRIQRTSQKIVYIFASRDSKKKFKEIKKIGMKVHGQAHLS